ncbi:tropomyosin-2 [Microbotryomycetes sp. JL201]|nr:tropomyosin-2 [Microbotryomycetes sp. JL201]
MDKIKEKLASLRNEADTAQARYEESEAKYKKLEHENMTKDQLIQSLEHQLANKEREIEALEQKATEGKSAKADEEAHKSVIEALNRKIALLEGELDNTEKQLREVTDKLRQTDVKAEHFERQVGRVEAERDSFEKKYEELQDKYNASKRELEEATLSAA